MIPGKMTRKQLLGSLLSLFVVCLIVVFPGWMAQTIEDVEISQEGLREYTEIVHNNTTSYSYTPYMNNNNSNSRGMYVSDIGYTVNSCIQDRGNTADYEEVTVQYGIGGTLDALITASNSFTGANLYYYFWGDAQQMLEDGANIISIYISMSGGIDYHLGNLLFVKLDWQDLIEDYHVVSPSGWSTPVQGQHTFQYEIPTEDLNSGATAQSGGSGTDLLLQMCIIAEDNGLSDKQIGLDVEISPEYYQESETTYNNTTTTGWEPYILGISNNYGWQKWSLGLGFFLIFATTLIGTPWINPSDWFHFPKSDENGPRTYKNRIMKHFKKGKKRKTTRKTGPPPPRSRTSQGPGKNEQNLKFLGSVISLLVVFTIVILPGWLAEEIQEIETANGNLVTFEEVVGGGEITYYPYQEMNETNEGQIKRGATIIDGVEGYTYSGDFREFFSNYNVNNYEDFFHYEGNNFKWYYIRMKMDPDSLYNDGADTIYIKINQSSAPYNLYYLKFQTMISNNVVSSITLFSSIGEGLSSADREYYLDLTETQLNNMMTEKATDNPDYCQFELQVLFDSNNYPWDPNFYSDFQISPGYYEEESGGSTGNNTVYVPYEYSITKKELRMVFLGIGGVFIIGTALVVSPIVNPSNIFSRVRSRAIDKKRRRS